LPIHPVRTLIAPPILPLFLPVHSAWKPRDSLGFLMDKQSRDKKYWQVCHHNKAMDRRCHSVVQHLPSMLEA
jgi:hypothetical protein